MNIIALYVPVYFKVDKELTKDSWWARFGPQASCRSGEITAWHAW